MRLITKNLLLTCLITASYGFVGCTPNAASPQVAKTDHANQRGQKDGDEHGKGKSEHAHDGWWCNEHGVPEAECALCNSRIAADFQKKGDWCKEHDRPDSQCFICHPEKLDAYAARYEAKFGKKPPKPDLN
ncbi:MAG: RND transporter [Planctomycetes bacterium]|nr:RND transporter [Planctomycetota bacterium]